MNPALTSDTDGMIGMDERICYWAPNIAVKLPMTAAGLRALEVCSSMGITVAATVSFTVPQVIEVAESHRRGVQEADKARTAAGKCFAVIMVGRLDDYLRSCCEDSELAIGEEDIRMAELAVTKRARLLYEQRGYPHQIARGCAQGHISHNRIGGW